MTAVTLGKAFAEGGEEQVPTAPAAERDPDRGLRTPRWVTPPSTDRRAPGRRSPTTRTTGSAATIAKSASSFTSQLAAYR